MATKVFLFVQMVMLMACVPILNASSLSRLQLKLPRVDSPQDDTLVNTDDGSFESQSEPDDAGRLREALESLLVLNDGELKALLGGLPTSTVADQISPATEFILRGNKKPLQQLKKRLQRKEVQREDMKIARRKKAFQRLLHSEAELEDSIEREMEGYTHNQDADSLLGALADLSSYLDTNDDVIDSKGNQKPRSRRSHAKKHKKRSKYHSRKSKSIHYSSWLRSDECPTSTDGVQKVFCPSPTADGDWTCIEDVDLCDGHSHCPGHEDEDPKACLFFNALRNHVNLLESAIIFSRRS